MDPTREERWQNYHKNYRLTGQFSNDRQYFHIQPRHGVFKTLRNNNHFRSRRNGYVLKRDVKFAKRKNGGNNASKSPKPSTEDAEEEERKKKLTDTANKLLSKIKTWNAENNSSGSCNKSNQTTLVNELVNLPPSSSTASEDNSKKPKRIAHSKTTVARVKKKQKTPVLFPKALNESFNYDVNKATVKDFQNRIQHKLINEIMQMPKENLQNVLNDPKINPRIEVKMSCLVRENKLLIAQRLRALAESKIPSNDSVTSSQLLVDIDKLIDPVIETDLSVLPYELIKQMENIFQVQFEYSNTESCGESQGIQEDKSSVINNLNVADNVDFALKDVDVKVSNCSEDFGVYECSTDEDVEIRVLDEKMQCVSEREGRVFEKGDDWSKKRRLGSEKNDCIEEKTKESIVGCLKVRNFAQEENLICSNQTVSENSAGEPPSQLVSIATQTVGKSKNVETQTISEPKFLYGVPLPETAADDCPASLLEEISSIQRLLNVLNERRFMIFLHLARTNPSGSFITSRIGNENFVESVSNGNIYLVESLMRFFRENHKFGVKARKSKPSKKKKKKAMRKQMGGNQNPVQPS